MCRSILIQSPLSILLLLLLLLMLGSNFSRESLRFHSDGDCIWSRLSISITSMSTSKNKSKKRGSTKRLRASLVDLPFTTGNSEELPTVSHKARVVEWQTRTFEGRMPKGMRVQVPPRAFFVATVHRLLVRRWQVSRRRREQSSEERREDAHALAKLRETESTRL